MADVKITVVAKLQPGEIFDELAAKNVKPICDAVETGKTYLSARTPYLSFIWFLIH